MKIIFFGTPPFAAKVLDFLLKNKIDIVAVVTKPDRPKGRSAIPQPTPVKIVAQAHEPSLPVFQPELVSSLDFAPTLSALQADLFVVVAYGEIIKQHLLDMPKKGCINLHASLLPKYRGAGPIQHCLIDGETETGVSIIHMVKKMDAGDIIAISKVPIGLNTTSGELEDQLCEIGSFTLLEVLKDIEKNKDQRLIQDSSQVTFAPKIELEDCEIHWKRSAIELHNLIRGVNPHPGAWCKVKIKNKELRLKINRTEVLQASKGFPGEILKYNVEGFIVACGEGALKLIEVQLEGKKAMPIQDLMRGIPQGEIFFNSNL